MVVVVIITYSTVMDSRSVRFHADPYNQTIWVQSTLAYSGDPLPNKLRLYVMLRRAY